MSRLEARRRLQEADPNLTIVHGRPAPYAVHNKRIPKILSREEAEWLGADEMPPIIVAEQNLEIQGKWSKNDLVDLCWSFGIDPRNFTKDVLVDALVWAGILDGEGNRTNKQPRPRR